MNSPLLNYRNRVLNPANPINWEHPLNRGLVGCWMVPPNPGFRGAQTLWDLTRGGRSPNNGTLTNRPTWQGAIGRPGGFGCLSFDTVDDYVTTPMSYTVLGTSYTIALWLRQNSVSIIQVALSIGGNCILTNGASSLRWQEDYGSFRITACTATRSAEVWYHMIVTSIGTAAGQTKIYLNGLQNDNGAASGALTSGTLEIGREQSSANRYWNGQIDDVRIYPRALSSAEAYALYNQSRLGHPDTMQWISSRAAFSAGAAPPTTPGVFNAAWWMVPNKNIGICRAV